MYHCHYQKTATNLQRKCKFQPSTLHYWGLKDCGRFGRSAWALMIQTEHWSHVITVQILPKSASKKGVDEPNELLRQLRLQLTFRCLLKSTTVVNVCIQMCTFSRAAEVDCWTSSTSYDGNRWDETARLWNIRISGVIRWSFFILCETECHQSASRFLPIDTKWLPKRTKGRERNEDFSIWVMKRK